MAVFSKLNGFVEHLAEGVHNFQTDQVAVALSNVAPGSESPSPVTGTANCILANVTEIDYTNLSSRNITTSSSSQTGGVYALVLDDLALNATGTVGPFRYVYLYNDTPTSPADPLIGYYDYGSELTLANGESLTVDFGANLFTLSYTTSVADNFIEPDFIAATGTVYQPTVAPGAVTVAPNYLAAASTVYNPTVTQPAAYDSDAQAYFDAMTSAPNDTRKGLLDDLIVDLKADGVWAKLDALYIMAAHDAQAARVNAIDPTQVASVVNSPTFTTDRGYTGDGTSTYMDTGVNPSTAGGNYAQNSACMGVWSLSNVTGPLDLDIGSAAFNRMNSRSNNSNTLRGMVNGTSLQNYGNSTSVPDSLGMFTLVRTSSSNVTGYRNATSVGSVTQTSAAVPNANMDVLRGLTDETSRQISAAFFGGSLTGTDVSNLHTRLSTYLTAVGAI